MQINRRFTTAGASPYQSLSFVARSSSLTKRDGTSVFTQDVVVVPENWDQTSTDILAQKYFRRKGCDHQHANSLYNSPYTKPWIGQSDWFTGEGGHMGECEWDLRQTIHRIVGCWTSWGERLGYFDPENAQAFYDEMSYMLATQMFAPNSPQFFNTGLAWAYGITGEAQGHYYTEYDGLLPDGATRRSEDAYTHPATGGCFIQSIKDDLVGPGGIMDLWTREARIFKFGGGSGSNFSRIRGANEPLSGGGVSSGLISFLRVGDRAAGAIKSGGTSRRAAKLVCLDMDHPDIEEFIGWKVAEERKVAMMVAGSKALLRAWGELQVAVNGSAGGADPKANPTFAKALRRARQAGVPGGFLLEAVARLQQGRADMPLHELTTDWEGEAYDTISAQNVNNSVRVSDAFMEAMGNDGPWNLTQRTDGKVVKTVQAEVLWSQVAEAAWSVADPGLQFDDTINFWHTCPESGRINASNPCSEFMFLDDTTCNLGSVNLVRFLGADSTIDVDKFTHACELMTIALDITVSISQYPSKAMAENSACYRTLGGGYANLGGLLMRTGRAYDSEDGISMAAEITSHMTGVAYRTSARLAGELGSFPGFEENKAAMIKVLQQHQRLAHGIELDDTAKGPVHYRPLRIGDGPSAAVWDEVVELAKITGMRNAQVTVLAPTGTIGILMGCDTTGVEPDFALVKFKKLAGGGYMKLVNGGVPFALRRLGYAESRIVAIEDYISGKNVGNPMITSITPSDLYRAGFGDSDIVGWNDKLKAAFDPAMVLPVPELVKQFGQARVDAFLLDVGGCGTIEGAPHLKPEHLAIFDCASKCGRTGTRSISPEGHLKMMAAVQPFLSGAISKTVNVPNDTTIAQIGDLYLQAWSMGIKSVAIYRDGSKLSQPLATSMDLLEVAEVIQDPEPAPTVKILAVAEQLTQHAIRHKLPTRRGGYTQAAKIGDAKLYLRTGEYEDGSLGEIFLDSYKDGAGYKAILNAFAIAISLGLQYGVPLEEFCDAYLFTKFEPNGPVQGHEAVKMCLSVLDFIFRDLAITYLHRYDLAHVKPEDLIAESGPKGKPMAVNTKPTPVFPQVTEEEMVNVDELKLFRGDVQEAQLRQTIRTLNQAEQDTLSSRMRGYTGNACPNCGHLTLVRSGTCNKCMTCGSTTGCS